MELSGKFECSNLIGQSNCLLPILGVSLKGKERRFFRETNCEHFFKVIRKSHIPRTNCCFII